jgi:hypothetical protein
MLPLLHLLLQQLIHLCTVQVMQQELLQLLQPLQSLQLTVHVTCPLLASPRAMGKRLHTAAWLHLLLLLLLLAAVTPMGQSLHLHCC